MRIKLLDSFRGKQKGDVIDWPDPMAQILIDQKRAIEIKLSASVTINKEVEEKDKAIDEPPVDKMQRKPVGKKRA